MGIIIAFIFGFFAGGFFGMMLIALVIANGDDREE